MKKIVFVVLMMVEISFVSHGQGGSTLDRVRGSMGVSLAGGIGEKVGLYRIGYYYWYTNKFMVRTDFFYVTSRSGEVKGYSIARYGLDVTTSYQVATIRKKVFFNLLAGISGAWNTFRAERGDFDYKDTMKFGFVGGGEMEVRLYRKLMGVLAGDTRYMLGNSFGNWRVYGTVGLRYIF